MRLLLRSGNYVTVGFLVRKNPFVAWQHPSSAGGRTWVRGPGEFCSVHRKPGTLGSNTRHAGIAIVLRGHLEGLHHPDSRTVASRGVVFPCCALSCLPQCFRKR
jgi:hypothetical protein